MHPSEGDLRAYLDEALSGAEQAWIRAHLAHCAPCREQATHLQERGRWVAQRLALLAPHDPPLPAPLARARLGQPRHPHKERRSMQSLPMSQPYRPLWRGLAVAALLLMSLLLPPVRALATDFLALFRVQQIQVVSVDMDSLPTLRGSAAQVERLLANNVQVQPQGQPADAASAASASALAGFPVRLPSAAPGAPVLRVQSGAELQLTLDVAQIRTLLTALGHAEFDLPDSLDGEQVVVTVPQGVMARYGACQSEAPPCLTLLQLPSPTVAAPSALDLQALGALFLEMLGMDEAEAVRLSQQVDWATTLVVPIPRNNVTAQALHVDGVPATLFEELDDEAGTRYMLLWVREGIVYALTGFQSPDEALRLANSLE